MNTQHSSMPLSSLQQLIMKASFATSSDKQSALDLAGEPQREADELTSARQCLKHEARYLTRIAELERVQGVLVGALEGMLRDVQALMLESDGVAGLHLNGDIAPWGELEEGGRFERLSHMTDAVQALAAAQKPASLRDMTEADFDAVLDVGGQKPDANLWAIHIPGPDEYHAAPSEEVAQAMAKQLNADMARLFADRPITPATPSIASVTASVVPWPSDAKSHAKALIEFDASEWGIEQKPEGGDRELG